MALGVCWYRNEGPYMEANSAKEATTVKYPNQQKMYP